MKNNSGEKGLPLLYSNRLAFSKVLTMLDQKVVYTDILMFLEEEYDISISKSALTRLTAKRKESAETGVPLGELIDKRNKNGNVLDIRDKRNTQASSLPSQNSTRASLSHQEEEETKVYSSLEILDEIIQKGYNGIKDIDIVPTATMLKSMELRNKIGGDDSGGLSLVGVKELALRYNASIDALTTIVYSYIPEDKIEEVADKIEEIEQDFYANLDLSDEEKRITDALRKSGL